MMDGVSGNRTPRAIREYERAHGLPADGQIRSGLLTTMSLARAGAFYWNRRRAATKSDKL